MINFIVLFVWSGWIYGAGMGVPFRADAGPSQLEIMAVPVQDEGILAAWAELSGLGELSCSFSYSPDHGSSWRKTLSYRAPGYQVGINPVVTVGPNGDFYALCLSGKADQSGSVLEMSVSTDSGLTWSDWKFIAQREGWHIVDKPAVLITPENKMLIAYADISLTPPSGRSLPHRGVNSSGLVIKSVDLESLEITSVNTAKVNFMVQGISMTFDKSTQRVLASFGEYDNGIHLATLSPDLSSISELETLLPGDQEAFTPITQLLIDNEGKIYVIAYGAHTPDKSFVIFKGENEWEVKNFGKSRTLLAGSLDAAGNVLVLSTEVKGNRFAVGLDYMNAKTKKWEDSEIHPLSVVPNIRFSIGAYQSFIVFPDNKFVGFYLDYGEYHTKVKQVSGDINFIF